MPGMREDATTDDYRSAMDGKGDFGSLGYEWSDKPHRLVYDLCNEVDRLQALLNGRDKFIVDQGLWQAFVDQLPKS